MTEALNESADDSNYQNEDEGHVDCSKALEAFGGDSSSAKFLAIIASCVSGPLGYSSFKNPDKPAWYGEVYGIDGVITRKLFAEAADILDINGEPLLDIHGRFLTWFKCGFVLMLVPFSGVLLAYFTKSDQTSRKSSAAVCLPIFCVGTIGWAILGYMWRFSQAGKFASGDSSFTEEMNDEEKAAWEAALIGEDSLFQMWSGQYIFITNVSYYWVIALLVLCALID